MELVPDAPLIDGRVTLRQWEESDAAFYARETGDAEIQRWTTEPAALTEQIVSEVLSRHRAHPRHAAFAITVATTDEVAGNIALVSDEWFDRCGGGHVLDCRRVARPRLLLGRPAAALSVGVPRASPASHRACDRPRQPALAADRRSGRFRDGREGAGAKGREP